MTDQQLTLGSLCSGYGGLDLAAEQIFRCRTIWHAEFEDAPSRVLAHHWPDVPNLHDITAIDWGNLERPDIVTAGYPCQPFSLAGARKGKDDERHLWPDILTGINTLAPRHVLLENVRGHLSLGFDEVLLDLATIGYAAAWRIVAASEIGGCHKRERLFIYAEPFGYAAPASPAATPLARLIDAHDVWGWVEPEADLFGTHEPWGGEIPASGRMVDGVIYAHNYGREYPGQAEHKLFPTPAAMMPNDGEGIDTWQARHDFHAAKAEGATRSGMPLAIAVQTLPTPTAGDSESSGGSNPQNVTLTDAVVRTELGKRTNPRFLPTPDAYAGSRGGSQDPEKRKAGGHTVSLADVIEKSKHLLPTPRSSRGASSTEISIALGAEVEHGDRTQCIAVIRGASWGPYLSAIEGHAALLGRTPPSPTAPNLKGNQQLSAQFVEWMQGLEPGHVTDPALWGHVPPTTARQMQLKMLGNGVFPHQAAAAYRRMISHD